jgi:hypothetical protein
MYDFLYRRWIYPRLRRRRFKGDYAARLSAAASVGRLSRREIDRITYTRLADALGPARDQSEFGRKRLPPVDWASDLDALPELLRA